MAALNRYDPTAHEKLKSAKIQEIFETKVHYLIRGRNAWHSTWVTHYYPRSFHTDLPSAKQQAEVMREPGSVFTIHEQPGLLFRTNRGNLLLTEINTAIPLEAWTKSYRSEKSEFQLNQGWCRLETVIRPGVKISTVLSALDDYRIFPVYRPWLSKNILALVSHEANAFSPDSRPRLKSWRSSSVGPDYYLNWNEGRAEVSGRSIRRVASALSARLAARSS